LYYPYFPRANTAYKNNMVNKELKALIAPLKNHILEQIEKEVPSYAKKRQRWNELATGLAVTVKFQPLDCEVSPAQVCAGLRDVTGKSLRSDSSIKRLLQTMGAYGMLNQVYIGPVKRPVTYLIAIEGVSDFLV